MERNIQEDARKYAEQVLHRELDAVAKAYIDGYNSAKGIVDDGEMTYVDLGLPSGTLWATKFMGATEEHPEGSRMVYADAMRYNIPTVQQVNELSAIPSEIRNNTVTFYGINGNTLSLPVIGYIAAGNLKSNLAFWVNNSINDAHRISIACYDLIKNGWGLRFTYVYIGSFISVETVKIK